MPKSHLPAAIAVSMCLVVVDSIPIDSRIAAVDHDVLDAATPNLSGTFANRSDPGHCRIEASNATEAELRLVQISQRRDSLMLRSAGISGLRFIPIESRRLGHRRPGLLISGVGRWEGNALVVYTPPPSAPMWLDVVPSIGGLVERFEVVGTTLQYDAWYTAAGEFTVEEPFSLSLARCLKG
jgi:hypothetical protein